MLLQPLGTMISKSLREKYFARRCGATDVMSPHKGKSPCRAVSFGAPWPRHKGLARQFPQRVLKARCRTFEAEDLFAHLVQIADAGTSYPLCLGTRADGAHPSLESCLPQRWPTLLQILQIFGEQSTTQPGPIQLHRVQIGRLLTLPCAKSFYPNAFSRQHSATKPPRNENATYDTPLRKKFLSRCLFKTTC